MPNDTDHAIRLERLERIENFLDSRFPEWNNTKPTPVPHPLAGLEWRVNGGPWYPGHIWEVDWDWNYEWRDSITHARVPLSEVARRLGVKPSSEVECKTKPATDFRVGDLVEVVQPMRPWFEAGERFVVHLVDGEYIIRRDKMMIASEQVRLISRP
jgi:hypothetical protein